MLLGNATFENLLIKRFATSSVVIAVGSQIWHAYEEV